MKLTNLFCLPAFLAVLTLSHAQTSPDYSEHLNLRPLPNHHLYAGFNFTASTPLETYESQHYRYFPRSLAQILQNSHTAELHLRFALGRWDEESWGRRPRDGRKEGGTGVELWAWVEGDNDAEVQQRWSALVNSLSGLFCASLNFIDNTKTTRPVLTFEPEGTHHDNTRLQLLHGMLPHEVVCTENLTPFLKLLPCKGKAGISSLLDGHKVFDASWQSMSIDVRPVCSEAGAKDCVLEIQQTIDMALSLPRSMRDRHNPIPRPPPIEEVECDASKPYNAPDTCYPKVFDGEMEWNLGKVFGRNMKGSCPLGGQVGVERWDVSLEVPPEQTVESSGAFHESRLGSSSTRVYQLEPNTDFDLHLPSQQISDEDTASSLITQPPLRASRGMTGFGQERGAMHTTFHNPSTQHQRVVLLESLPWFLRPYMHTLSSSNDTALEQMFYTPALDRERGTQLELLLSIPANSSLELSYDFEKAILRYTEYPPDANRGFDVAPAVVRILPSADSASTSQLNSGRSQGEYLRTTSLLLPLPTPDFSMPYNVIILTSTVIALGFGGIFNLLVRRFALPEEVPGSPLGAAIKNAIIKAKAAIGRRKERKVVDQVGQPSNEVDSIKDSVDSSKSTTTGIAGTGNANGKASMRNRS